MHLPAGYRSRPLDPADAALVAALIAAQQLRDTGEVQTEEADLVADWSQPDYDLPRRSIGIEAPDGRLAAYAEVRTAGRCDASVHPDHEGRGIGTALAGWMVERAGELGEAGVPGLRMPVPAGSAGDRLLECLDWPVLWTSWVLRLPAGARIPPRDLPAGCHVRDAAPTEVPRCWEIGEDAILEWAHRPRESYASWCSHVTGRPGHAPWQLRVVIDTAGEILSLVHVVLAGEAGHETGHVALVATRPEHRGRGLAQVLLRDAQTQAEARGAQGCELHTDSRSGARALYERLGMRVDSTWVTRGRAV